MGQRTPKPVEPRSGYITQEGYARLSAEFEQLYRVERPKVVKGVAEAAAEGDRSENAEYIYGKKKLREIDRRLRHLTRRLDAASGERFEREARLLSQLVHPNVVRLLDWGVAREHEVAQLHLGIHVGTTPGVDGSRRLGQGQGHRRARVYRRGPRRGGPTAARGPRCPWRWARWARSRAGTRR